MIPQDVANEGSEFVSFELVRQFLDFPPGDRPRVYGLLKDGQIVKIASNHYLDKYTEDGSLMEPVWISNTTIRGLVRKA